MRMLKLCDESTYKPLNLIFKSCLKTGQFLSEWKKANVVPIFKKGDKQLVKKYRPFSLLPITDKIFERLLYNQMFEIFIRNDLISQNQPGFKPGDSCINQLLAITHEIYKSFDACLDVRAVFLDISKAFDKVWHEGLLYKLKQNGISGNLLETLTDFLKDRKQRVVLNGQNSSWANVEAGVPQGSILGPLLFLIYINDLPDNLSANVKLFADDTSLFSVVHDITTSSCDLNYELNRGREWVFQWKMSFNLEPSKQAQKVIFTRKLQKKDYPPLYFNDSSVKETCKQKHLGMLLDFRLDFQEHWKSLVKKVNKTVALLRKFQNIPPRSALLTIYKCFVRTHLDYGDIIYDEALNNSFHQNIESLQ